jgi:HD-GYP domain-containing protein (c-di-GMP phosphodiesterase class II)
MENGQPKGSNPTQRCETAMLQSSTKKIDGVKKIKLNVVDLRPGMFVCELDRPWLDNPFRSQGFNIKDKHDIEVITRYCKYVYIDPMRNNSPKATIDDTPLGSFWKPTNNSFQLEGFKKAAAKREQTLNLIKSFVNEIRSGQSLDIQLAKAAVSECLSCILSDPEPMMFLTRLRNREEYASQHALNVCIYSLVVGNLLGLDRQHLENLGTCGMLHDMGAVVIPEYILNKPGKLNTQETLIMQTHAAQGRDILMSGRNLFNGIVDVAYGHHENLDGTGYPRGALGSELNMNCKIVAVVDKYDAISSMRPYRRRAGDHMNGVSILNKLAKGNKIHGKLTSIFISNLGFYPSGSIVELSSGEVGIVVNANPDEPLRPLILVLRNQHKDIARYWVDLAQRKVDSQGHPYRIASVRRPGDYGIDLGQSYDLIVQAFSQP